MSGGDGTGERVRENEKGGGGEKGKVILLSGGLDSLRLAGLSLVRPCSLQHR